MLGVTLIDLIHVITKATLNIFGEKRRRSEYATMCVKGLDFLSLFAWSWQLSSHKTLKWD